MTIIFANHKDIDCSLLSDMWANFDCKVVEITPDMEDYEEMVDEAIASEEDTLIFAGHGTTFGLLHPNFSMGYLFHSNNVDLVRAKNVICIWCHASTFCKTHGLKCLCSSMFITNIGESAALGIDSTQEHINETVTRFCKELNHCLVNKMPLSETYKYLAERTDEKDEVDTYNRNGVMLND